MRVECIDGITANKEHCRELVEHSIGIILTALKPFIGYANCTEVAKRLWKQVAAYINWYSTKNFLQRSNSTQFLILNI